MNIPYYLDKRRADQLIESIKNVKHRTCLLLMLDAGLKVSETITLRYKDFDFKKRLVQVKCKNTHYRSIPLSDRLYQVLANYIQTQQPTSNDDYLFPGKTQGHLTRKALNRVCDRIKTKYPEAFGKLHPHMLRHTFATHHLANGAQLADIKNMLGHQSLATTAIYAHTPLDKIRKSIQEVTRPKLTPLQKLRNWLYPLKSTPININTTSFDFTTGRHDELHQISTLIHKNCNTILLGPVGVGKTHLIQQIKKSDQKILSIDDCYDIKRTLIQCLLYLYKNDKEHVFNMLYGDYDLNKVQQNLQRDSIASLTQEIISITAKNEYIIVIDNVDNITARGIKALEALKDHFTILTSAREIPLNKSTFLWNFEIVPIKPLSRQHSLALIHRLSEGLEIEDLALYRNHIYEQANGNPRAIVELVNRYSKEAIITTDTIRSIKHMGSRKEYDMSVFVLILLGGLTTLRYVAHETGNDSLRFIGGVALLLLITARYFFRYAKRKTIH